MSTTDPPKYLIASFSQATSNNSDEIFSSVQNARLTQVKSRDFCSLRGRRIENVYKINTKEEADKFIGRASSDSGTSTIRSP